MDKDFLAITSDSGYLCIFEYNTNVHKFVRVGSYQYGRPGCLYDVPGQYLAVSAESGYIAIGLSLFSIS